MVPVENVTDAETLLRLWIRLTQNKNAMDTGKAPQAFLGTVTQPFQKHHLNGKQSTPIAIYYLPTLWTLAPHTSNMKQIPL